jgi:peptide/nickel transport system permease protein
MLVAPHMVLAPGVALFAVVLSVNLLGDRLRDRLDIRLAGANGTQPWK